MDRMRTIDEAYREISNYDPNTSVSKNAIRRLAKSGKIKTVFVGRRILVNLDSLIDYLGFSRENSPQSTTSGTIRQVPEHLTFKDLYGTRRRSGSNFFIEGDVVQITEELFRGIPKGTIGIVQFSKDEVCAVNIGILSVNVPIDRLQMLGHIQREKNE